MVKSLSTDPQGAQSPFSVYRLRPEMFARERRFLLAIPGVLLFIGSLVVVGLVSGSIEPVGLVIIAILVPLTLGTASAITIHRRKASWRTFELVLFPETIVRTQQGYLDLSIPIAQITELIRTPAGGYTIRGRKRTHAIEIPPGVGNPEGLENDLANLVPNARIVTKGVTGAQLKNAFVGIGAVVVLYSPNPWVVFLVAPLVVWPLLRDTWTLRSDPRVEATMRSRWPLLMLLALVVAPKAALITYLIIRKHVG